MDGGEKDRGTGRPRTSVITQAELGRRLRSARLTAGLTQDEVADALGVPRPTISQIEAGKRGVGSLELAELARLYERPMESFFDDAVTDDTLAILFRSDGLRPEDRHVIDEFCELCRSYADLEALIGVYEEASLPDYSSMGEPRNKRDAIRQGELLALEERRRLGIGDGPIRDVFELLDSQGVRLFVRPLENTSISGLFIYDRAIGPCVLINGAEHRNRLSFNAAHEYAHVLLDRKLGARVSITTRLLGDSDESQGLLEVRANSFAAAFLLPASGVDRFLHRRGMIRRHSRPVDIIDVLYLHRTFGVSYQAALYRLLNLGWLGKEERERMSHHRPEESARSLGLLDDDVLPMSSGNESRYPTRYVYLTLEAYRQAKIPIEQLAKLLGRSAREIGSLVDDLLERSTSARPVS